MDDAVVADGESRGLVVDDARRDVAGVFDNEWGGNYDRNSYEGVVFGGRGRMGRSMRL